MRDYRDTSFRPREGNGGLRRLWLHVLLPLRFRQLRASGRSVQIRGWLLSIKGGTRKGQGPKLGMTERLPPTAKRRGVRTETLHDETLII
jgi:hypothetical protein